MNEIAYYTAWQLFGIACSFCISFIGIKVLTMKIKHLKDEKKQLTPGGKEGSLNPDDFVSDKNI